jgi:hypothetical protein
MNIAAFKRQLNENVREALEIMEEEDYLETLPPEPTLEDWYALFFTVWNDRIGEVVFET